MDSPPKKRRRTSPRLSERNSQTSGSDNNVPTTTPPGPAPETSNPRSSRPSFASPTRASLARHNPQILDRRKSVPRDRGNRHSEAGPTVGASPRVSRENDPWDGDVLLDGPLGQSPQKATRALADALGDQPTRPLQQPPTRSPSRSPTRNMGSMFSEPARRTPVKPIPRPLPPADPARGEDVLQPLILQEKRRSGLDLFRTAEVEQEPELPPTPEHVDPDLSTSPPGIHTGTPTKPRGKRLHGKKLQSSSPLKQPPLRLPSPSKQQRLDPKSKPSQIEINLPTRKLRRGRSAHAARGISLPDADSDKKKEKQQLLAEIAQLGADFALAAKANGQIRDEVGGGDHLLTGSDRREILALLRRTALPAEEEEPDQATDWLQAIANPISLLPFGKPSSDLTQAFLFGESSSQDKEALPVSHHPIPMTASEELPYLQVFSPLAFASQIVVLPQETPDAPLLQKHLITVTSTTPRGMFLARIEMTVNSKSLKITELNVPKIEAAAEAELRPFVDRIASASHKEVGSALVRNVSVLVWAMGEWVRVAVRRAKFWALVEQQLATKDALEASVQTLREQGSKDRKRKKRGGRGADSEDEDGEDELSGDVPRTPDDALPLGELLPFMGKSSADIELPVSDEGSNSKNASSVRVQWGIEFDWTGEAQSRIGVLVGLPGKWRKADDRGHLARLPKLFDRMVQGNETPARAVQTVVALLAGDRSA